MVLIGSKFNTELLSVSHKGKKITKHILLSIFRDYNHRVSCKKVHPTLKVNIQHFHSTKIIKYIEILLLNECNFDNYPFFPLMIFFGDIIELYNMVVFEKFNGCFKQRNKS